LLKLLKNFCLNLCSISASDNVTTIWYSLNSIVIIAETENSTLQRSGIETKFELAT